MNWGQKIIVVFIVFVSGMLFLAFKASRQNIELVADDYYAKELVYQQQIDETKRTASLSTPVHIKIVGHILTIEFPPDFATKKIAGVVTLYCPSDEKKDMQQQFSVTDSPISITVPDNYSGLHYVKISWQSEGVNYYYEHKILI